MRTSRRRVLEVLGTGSAVGLAGCIVGSDSPSGPTRTDESSSGLPRETSEEDGFPVGGETDDRITAETTSEDRFPAGTADETPVDEVVAPEANRGVTVEWSVEDLPGEIASTGKQGDTVYVGTYAETLHAFDANTGDERWSAPFENWVTRITPTEDRLFVGVGGAACGVNPTNGTKEWRVPTEAFVSPLTVSEGAVYFGDDDGYAYAIDGTDGATRWKKQLTFSTSSDGRTTSHFEDHGTKPVVESQTVYIGGANHVWSLDAGNGTIGWHVESEAGDFTTPAVRANGRFLCGGETDVVTAVGPGDGEIEWTFRLADPSYAGATVAPLVDGERAIVGARTQESELDDFVHAFYELRLADGSVEERVRIPDSVDWLARSGNALYALVGGAVYVLDATSKAVLSYFRSDGSGDVATPVLSAGTVFYPRGRTLRRLTMST